MSNFSMPTQSFLFYLFPFCGNEKFFCFIWKNNICFSVTKSDLVSNKDVTRFFRSLEKDEGQSLFFITLSIYLEKSLEVASQKEAASIVFLFLMRYEMDFDPSKCVF